MTQSVADLFDAALALSEPERAELVELLVATVEASSNRHPTWGPNSAGESLKSSPAR